MGAVKNTVIAASVAALIPVVGINVGEAHAGGCPQEKAYAIGGVGDGQSRHVPGAPSNAERITYSASVAPVGGMTLGEQSKREAQNKLNRRARAFRAACPGSHITVYSYSLGSVAALDTRDSWNRDHRMNRNTKFVAVSDARSKNGVMSRLPAGLIGFKKPWARPNSVIETSHTCRTSDLICNIGDPLANPGATVNKLNGYLFGSEHLYSSREVNPAPGNHWVKPKQAPVIRAADPVRVQAPQNVTVTEPVTVNEVLPQEVRQYVLPQVREIVIPQNVLPKVPVVKLPPAPKIVLPKIALPKIG